MESKIIRVNPRMIDMSESRQRELALEDLGRARREADCDREWDKMCKVLRDAGLPVPEHEGA